MLGALDKAYNRSAGILSTVHSHALDMKAGGSMLDTLVTPTMMASPSDWQSSSKSRESYAMFRSWVFAAVNAVASESASQPINVGRIKGGLKETDGKKPGKTKAVLMEKMPNNTWKAATNKEMELVADHPLLDALERPNPIQYRFQFVYSIVANLNLTGRAYIVRDTGENGEDQFYALPTTWVKPDHSKGPFAQYQICNPRDMDFSRKDKPLDSSQVAMIHLPNPADPMGALSPAQSMSAAIRVDDRIQTCQEKFFDNGIFPSVVVTVGKDPHPDVPGGMRPRLTGIQRRQVTGAIRRVMGGVANFGNPAILDGLIESITRMSATQTELGWDKSEDKLQKRILAAFCVHPFILGEPLGVGGYAQAYNIMQRFYSRCNVFLDILSTTMTHFCNNKKQDKKKAAKATEPNEKLLIWWEKLVANDPSLDDANWRFARTNGDVTSGEYRSHKLGLPPIDNKPEAIIPPLMLQGIAGVLVSVGMGSVQPEQCAALLIGCGVPEDLASTISGRVNQGGVDGATQELKRAIALLKMPDAMQQAEQIVHQLVYNP